MAISILWFELRHSWRSCWEDVQLNSLCRNNKDDFCRTYPWRKICITQWASYQIRKIVGCACTGNTGNVFPTTAGSRSRHASRHVRDVAVSFEVGWRGKRSRHSRRMRSPQFSYLARGPCIRLRVYPSFMEPFTSWHFHGFHVSCRWWMH